LERDSAQLAVLADEGDDSGGAIDRALLEAGDLISAHARAYRASGAAETEGNAGLGGAGCRDRTRDLRFTKPLLYHLS
jgi:hypothetical protein